MKYNDNRVDDLSKFIDENNIRPETAMVYIKLLELDILAAQNSNLSQINDAVGRVAASIRNR